MNGGYPPDLDSPAFAGHPADLAPTGAYLDLILWVLIGLAVFGVVLYFWGSIIYRRKG